MSRTLCCTAILGSVLFCFLIATHSPAQDGFDPGDFRHFVENEMRTWNVPGAAVLIVQDGKVIFSEGFGYRDVENKLKVTPDTIFSPSHPVLKPLLLLPSVC